jgi:hypothetical protein
MVSGEEQIDMVQIFLSHPQKHDFKKSRHRGDGIFFSGVTFSYKFKNNRGRDLDDHFFTFFECRQEAGDTSYIDMV